MGQREQLTQFFLSELDSLEHKTGCTQMSRILSLKNPETELARFVTALVDKCVEPPFDRMAAEVKMRVIQDQMMRDDQFVSPPYGQLPGFNQRIIGKWLSAHYNLHADQIERKASQQPMAYDEYLKHCAVHQMEPMTKEQFEQPLTQERIDYWASQFKKQLASMSESPRVHNNALRSRFGKSVLPEYMASKKKFVIDGIEIIAETQEEAEQQYKQIQQ